MIDYEGKYFYWVGLLDNFNISNVNTLDVESDKK